MSEDKKTVVIKLTAVDAEAPDMYYKYIEDNTSSEGIETYRLDRRKVTAAAIEFVVVLTAANVILQIATLLVKGINLLQKKRGKGTQRPHIYVKIGDVDILIENVTSEAVQKIVTSIAHYKFSSEERNFLKQLTPDHWIGRDGVILPYEWQESLGQWVDSLVNTGSLTLTKQYKSKYFNLAVSLNAPANVPRNVVLYNLIEIFKLIINEITVCDKYIRRLDINDGDMNMRVESDASVDSLLSFRIEIHS
ncbi:hypothetical protein ES705_45705 [subsurface metagenome]